MLKNTLGILLGSTLVAAVWAADPPKTPVLDQRQDNQAARVEKGKETGQLNEREAKRLEHAADRLETNEAKAKADGLVTDAERRRLNREAEVNSARIRKQKHDKQGDRTRNRDSNHDGK